MENKRLSELASMGTPDFNNDYVLIVDVSGSQLAKALMKYLKAPDDDFYNTLSEATQSTNYDHILIWDGSFGQYRKAALGVFTAPETTALKGFFLGGRNAGGTPVATTDKFNITSETASAVAAANLSMIRYGLSSITWENAAVAYHFGGTSTTDYSGVVYNTDKTQLASEITVTYAVAYLYQGRYMHASGGNGVSHGYIAGGNRGGYPYNDTERFYFFTEVCTRTTSAFLTSARQGLGWSNYQYYQSYFLGGSTPTYQTSCDKIVYSTDTTASVGGGILSQARDQMCCCGDNVSKGYFLGGYTGANVTTCDKLTYATETTVNVPGAPLVTARRGMAGISQGSTYGYFSGGFDSAVSAVTERLVMATDTVAVVAGGSITAARQNLTSCSEVNW